MTVEVCANSLQSALNAEQAGADRIELCTELGVGGITPSYGLIKRVKESIKIPVHVLIRPRSGDFTYNDREISIMKEDIHKCLDLGCEGIVAGVLGKDNEIDIERTLELKKASGTSKFTFHRAFDWVPNPLDTIEVLSQMKVDFILSSGQKKSALEGIELLIRMKHVSSFSKILPGGGIKPENAHLFKQSGFESLHLSGIKFHRSLSRKPELTMNYPAFLEEDQQGVSDVKLIQKVVEIVK